MSDIERQTARVKWFNPKAGYGFLTDCSDSKDVFVHHSQITTKDNVYKTLTQGEYVDFGTTTDESGKILATNVTGVKGGPLLCERPKRVNRKASRKSSEEVTDEPVQAEESS